MREISQDQRSRRALRFGAGRGGKRTSFHCSGEKSREKKGREGSPKGKQLVKAVRKGAKGGIRSRGKEFQEESAHREE